MGDISFRDIECATDVLHEIANELRVKLILGEFPPREGRVGDPPNATYACTVKPPRARKYRVYSLCPAACPNVIESIMHELAHCALGFPPDDNWGDDAYNLDRRVLRLELTWAARLPQDLAEVVRKDVQEVLDHYDKEDF